MAFTYESEEDEFVNQLVNQIGKDIEPLARLWWGPPVYRVLLDPKALQVQGVYLSPRFDMSTARRTIIMKWASATRGPIAPHSATCALYTPGNAGRMNGLRAQLNNSCISGSLMKVASLNMLEEGMEGHEDAWFGIAKIGHPRIRDYLQKVKYNLMVGKGIHFVDLPGDYMDEFMCGIIDQEDKPWKQFCTRMLQESIPQEVILRQVYRGSPWDSVAESLAL